MSYLKAADTISGAEGTAKARINGVEVDLFYIKNLEATMEKNKTQVKTLGHRGTQHKPNGWTGSGSMTMYYVTSKFREMAYNYATKGIDVYFDITITNYDPSSTVGSQVVKLVNCNLDSITLAKLDVDAEVLEEDIDFTFDSFELTKQFGAPTLA